MNERLRRYRLRRLPTPEEVELRRYVMGIFGIPILLDQDMDPKKVGLVNNDGRGVAMDTEAGEVMEHIGPPLPPRLRRE